MVFQINRVEEQMTEVDDQLVRVHSESLDFMKPLKDPEDEALVQEAVKRAKEHGRIINAKYKASIGSIAITPEELYLSDLCDNLR